MKNKHIICLLVCNLITCGINASEKSQHNYEQNIQVSNNVNQIMSTNDNNNLVQNNAEVGIVNNSNATYNNQLANNTNEINPRNISMDFIKLLYNVASTLMQNNILERNVQANNHYLIITNNNLNCAFISLVQCLHSLNSTNNKFLSQLQTRYNDLLRIQQVDKYYEVLPIDILVYLLTNNITDGELNHINRNVNDTLIDKHELMKLEHEFAKLSNSHDVIREIYYKLREIHGKIKINNIAEFNNILKPNSEPMDIFIYLKGFSVSLMQEHEQNDVLPMYNLCIDGGQYKLSYQFQSFKKYDIEQDRVEDYNGSNNNDIVIDNYNNVVVNCGNVFLGTNKDKIKNFVNGMELFNNIDNTVQSNRTPQLKAISFRLYNMENMYNEQEVKHYIALVKQSNTLLESIDDTYRDIKRFSSLSDFIDNYECKLQYDSIMPVMLFYSNDQKNTNNPIIEKQKSIESDNEKQKLNNISKRINTLAQKYIDNDNINNLEKQNNDNNDFINLNENNIEEFNNINFISNQDNINNIKNEQKLNNSKYNKHKEAIDYENKLYLDEIFNINKNNEKPSMNIKEDNKKNKCKSINEKQKDNNTNQFDWDDYVNNIIPLDIYNIQKSDNLNKTKYNNEIEKSKNFETNNEQLPLEEDNYDSDNIDNINEIGNNKQIKKTSINNNKNIEESNYKKYESMTNKKRQINYDGDISEDDKSENSSYSHNPNKKKKK